MRCAIISVGTNSCRLLIANDGEGTWQPEYHELHGTRLGEGLRVAGRLQKAAIERTLAAVRAMGDLAHGADERFGIGTSALRDAANADEFAHAFSREAGLELQILSGEEEARSSYAGALMGLATAGIDVANDVCVVDIGGGSTEIAVGRARFEPDVVTSVELGAVGLTEAAMRCDPPSTEEVERATMTARLALQAAAASLGRPGAAVTAVGGTADAAARMLQAYETAGSGIQNAAIVRRPDLDALLKLVLSVPTEQRKKLRGLPEQRADIFPAGLIILIELLAAFGQDRARITQSDLLLGYIARNSRR